MSQSRKNQEANQQKSHFLGIFKRLKLANMLNDDIIKA